MGSFITVHVFPTGVAFLFLDMPEEALHSGYGYLPEPDAAVFDELSVDLGGGDAWILRFQETDLGLEVLVELPADAFIFLLCGMSPSKPSF